MILLGGDTKPQGLLPGEHPNVIWAYSCLVIPAFLVMTQMALTRSMRHLNENFITFCMNVLNLILMFLYMLAFNTDFNFVLDLPIIVWILILFTSLLDVLASNFRL